MYNKSAAYATIKHAQQEGFEVMKLQCDVEYVRQPLGFLQIWSLNSNLCLAASHNIDSVAFGTVMESAYRIGHQKARDYATSHHYRFWGRMFAAAGIPLYLPVSGVVKLEPVSSFMQHHSMITPVHAYEANGQNHVSNVGNAFEKHADAKIGGKTISENYLPRV